MSKRYVVFLVSLFASAVVLGQSAEPVDAAGWFRLGISKHDAGDYGGAVVAYRKAESLHFGQIVPLLIREARAYTRIGDRDQAFAALKRLTDAGFANAEMIDAENDFLPIRLDVRYAQTIESAKKNAHPCLAPEFRQFDYWLGEWDVQSDGKKIAHSSIQLILGECVIFENYDSLRGYSGKSFSIYDAPHQRWEQRYVDTSGAFHEWVGGLADGRMQFLWRHDGQLERMTYTREGLDKVRQLLESSSDEGKSWSTTYDGLYVRRN